MGAVTFAVGPTPAHLRTASPQADHRLRLPATVMSLEIGHLQSLVSSLSVCTSNLLLKQRIGDELNGVTSRNGTNRTKRIRGDLRLLFFALVAQE